MSVVQVEVELKQALKDGIRQYYDGQLNSSNAFSRAFDFAQVEVRILVFLVFVFVFDRSLSM